MTTRLFLFFLCFSWSAMAQEFHFRINQAGYVPGESKVALLMSGKPLKGKVDLVDLKSGFVVSRIRPRRAKGKAWGQFSKQYTADFSDVDQPGLRGGGR